jgi:phosphatidylserine decarboxylase
VGAVTGGRFRVSRDRRGASAAISLLTGNSQDAIKFLRAEEVRLFERPMTVHREIPVKRKEKLEPSRARRILWGQIAILAICGFALIALASNFPYPSPLIKPLLPPKLRWPSAQIAAWVEEGEFDRDFAKFFARDPERDIPAAATMVSPADGIVQTMATIKDITYFVVGLSFWDVHVVRTPIAGTVKDISIEGAYFERLAPAEKTREMHMLRGKAAPVQGVVTLATDRGDVRIRLVSSYWASRIKIWVWPGQKIAKGDRIGRMLAGSTVVAEFPGKLSFQTKLGEHVQGGSTVLATH